MMMESDSGRASVMSSSDSLESVKVTSTLDALQQGPRPLPLFLQMAQNEAGGERARLSRILAGLRAFQAAERPPPPPSDRKSGVWGTKVYVRAQLGGRRII